MAQDVNQVTLSQRLRALVERCEVMPRIDIPTESVGFIAKEALDQLTEARELLVEATCRKTTPTLSPIAWDEKARTFLAKYPVEK